MSASRRQLATPHKFGFIGRGWNGLITRAIGAGWRRTSVIAAALAVILGVLIYWQYVTPLGPVKEALLKENGAQNRQIAIAQTVQETRPAFIKEYRKAKDVYEQARELLPNNTKLSEVMAVSQEIARRNGVRMTLFDALTPNVRSAIGNNVGEAAPPADPSLQTAQPPANKTVLNERSIPAQLTGKHGPVLNFLRELAIYDLIIDARDIKITSLNNQENVSVKLVAFDAPPTSALAPDPAELRESAKEGHRASLIPKK